VRIKFLIKFEDFILASTGLQRKFSLQIMAKKGGARMHEFDKKGVCTRCGADYSWFWSPCETRTEEEEDEE